MLTIDPGFRILLRFQSDHHHIIHRRIHELEIAHHSVSSQSLTTPPRLESQTRSTCDELKCKQPGCAPTRSSDEIIVELWLPMTIV